MPCRRDASLEEAVSLQHWAEPTRVSIANLLGRYYGALGVNLSLEKRARRDLSVSVIKTQGLV